MHTQEVILNLVLYEDFGFPLSISCKSAEFILGNLELDPSLYVNKIQAHIKAMKGIIHPFATIKDELKVNIKDEVKACLHMTKKVSRMVHHA